MDNKENKEIKFDLDNTEVDLSPLDLKKENYVQSNTDKIKEETEDYTTKENSNIDKEKIKIKNRKKAIPFIAHVIGIIFISMTIVGVLQTPDLNVKEFYNSTRFNEVLRQYNDYVMEYIKATKDGYYEEYDKKQAEYEAKLEAIQIKYEEEKKNTDIEIDNIINTIREGKDWTTISEFLGYFGMNYESWKGASDLEKENYLRDYKTNHLSPQFEDKLQESKDVEISNAESEVNKWNYYDNRNEARRYVLDYYENLKFYAIDKTSGTVYTSIENLNSENFSEEFLKNNSQFIMSIKGNRHTGISEVTSPLDEKVFKRHYDLYFNSDRYKDFDVYYIVPSVIRLHDDIYNIIKSYDSEINSDVMHGILIAGVAGTIIYLIYLIIRRKRLLNEGLLDRIYRWLYTEIKLIFSSGGALVVAIFFCEVIHICFGGYSYYSYYSDRILMVAIYVLGVMGLTLTIVLFNIKYIRNSKNILRDIVNRSILFRGVKFICKLIGKIIKVVPNKFKRAIELSYFQGNKVYRYWIGLAVGGVTVGGALAVTLFSIMAYEFVVLLIPISIVIGAGICYFVIYYMDSLQEIVTATDDICNGNFNVNVQEKGDFVTKKLAHNINNINNGLKVAVDNEIRSERMKGELITNVSHDLKTPLTSIINYVDLLKDERATEEEKKKYIEILERKSQRLKVLIEDLFEVSKATSGTMELNIEEVEVSALLRQAFGELKEKIDNSSVSFRTKFSDNKIYSKLDGNKTWRVFENLLVNILKYSLPGSRAYIELNDLGEHVQIIMKNTSQEELAFTSDEIVERFKRGDISRNTDGSGLGLAISKSIVELQGGAFSVDIDGDLFKVTITFEKVNK